MKRRHYFIDDSIYPVFITTTITKWVPVFSDDKLARDALSILENARKRFKAHIMAYVLMPNHLHAIIKTANKGDLSRLIKYWKALSARLIIDLCKMNNPEWLAIFCRSAREFKRNPQLEHQVWQPRFDEFAIRTEQQLSTKLNYIHGNPLKHKIDLSSEDYPYCSERDYQEMKNHYLTVDVFSVDCNQIICGHNEL